MQKHTPGPWIWAEDYKGLYGAGRDNKVLDHAHCEGMWLADDLEANALLIAAAPDMLAQLRTAVFHLRRSDFKNNDSLTEQAITSIEKTIEQATGGAS